MKRETNSSLEREIPAFKISVNISDFQYRKSSLKEKLQREYIPYYWGKCGMDQKAVLESGEDRLSELTTGQIDRIIDMQKIKGLLYDRKRKVKDAYFQFDDSNPNLHPNVYQANFLAKINEIAIKRNIRHQDMEGFDELIKQKLEKIKLKNEQRKKLVMPYKYAKRYCSDTSERRTKTEYNEDDEVKSIDSIEDDLDEFEQRIQKGTVRQGRRDRGKAQVNKLLPPKRWFYGMSTYYINKNQPQQMPPPQEVLKSNSYDIEAEVKLISEIRSTSFCSRRGYGNVTHSTASTKQREHLRNHKVNHVTMLKVK